MIARGPNVSRMTGQTTLIAIAALILASPRPADAQQKERRRLDRQVVLDGVTCAPTGNAYAEFHPSGRLAECPIAADTTMFGQRFPMLTWVGFTAEGLPFSAWLARDALLSGYECHGTGYKGYSVRFYPDGTLKSCFLATDSPIQGAHCIRGSFWTEIRGGTKSQVSFHDNGRLARCQASRAFERDRVRFRKWQLVVLDRDGRARPPG
jgi:hypothetical protein